MKSFKEIIQLIGDNKVKKIRIPNTITNTSSGINTEDIKSGILKGYYFEKTTSMSYAEMQIIAESKNKWYLRGEMFPGTEDFSEMLMCGEKSCKRILCPTFDWWSVPK